MASRIGKMAPTVVVVAAAGYCAWPYVFPSAGAGKPLAAMPEIASAQPPRRPFCRRRPATHFGRRASLRGDPRTGRSPARQPKRPAPPARVPRRRLPPRPARENRRPICWAAWPWALRAYWPASDWRDQRADDAEREPLRTKDASAPPCIVARILPDRVLLECEGRTLALGYANVVAQPKTDHAHGGAAVLPERGTPPPRRQSPAAARRSGPRDQPQP